MKRLPSISSVLPYVLAGGSLIICAFFLQIHLIESSRRFAEDFRKQNIGAIASADTLTLASRLNSLSSSVHWVCITALRDGQIFYETKKGRCSPGPFRSVVEVGGSPGNLLKILFTLQLSEELENAGILFILLQAALLGSLAVSSKHVERARIQEKMRGEIALANIAAQVSHDIRSPLASLLVVVERARGLDEQSRKLIQEASFRIRDIANQMLEKYRAKNKGGARIFELSDSSSEPVTTESFQQVVDAIFLQKKVQFAGLRNIEFKFNSKVSHGLFVEIQKTEFSTLMSNLINNAVESLGSGGVVRLESECEDDRVCLRVVDNGRGIPQHILPRLGERGATFGKREGSGLGLFHARRALANWGGSLNVSSEVESGTVVEVVLPKGEAPVWFLEKLSLVSGTIVVILDQNKIFHRKWEERFSSIKPVSLRMFENSRSFTDWVRENVGINNSVLYLLDHDPAGGGLTGLDLIDMFGISQQSVLVAKDAASPEVIGKCEKRKLKLLPKELISSLSIELR